MITTLRIFMESLLNFDIFYKISQHLRVKSIHKFILTCQNTLSLYNANESYINTLMCKKMLQELQISNDDKWFDQLSKHTKKIVKRQVLQLYKLPYSEEQYFSYFLIELVSRGHSDPNNTLFLHILRQCTLGEMSRKKISNTAMISLCMSGDITQVSLLLKHFTLNSQLIYYIINCLLFSKDSDYKIVLCLNHLFIKHCMPQFNPNSHIHFHNILVDIIYHHQFKILEYILEKRDKYKFHLNFQHLINSCIRFDSHLCLRLLHSELKKSNTDFRIIIDPINIGFLFHRGKLDSLQYILDDMLGSNINAKYYIEQIHISLQYLIFTNTRVNKHRFDLLKPYLNRENLEMLQPSYELLQNVKPKQQKN
jgi:hypothetical protein